MASNDETWVFTVASPMYRRAPISVLLSPSVSNRSTASSRSVSRADAAAGSYGYANPIMLVHAVTAPNAVLRVLPVLPEAMWPATVAAAWAATAAITAAYAPAAPRPLPPPRTDLTVADLADRAVAIGEPHAIGYADTVADVLAAAPDPVLLTAAVRSVDELAG